LEKTKQIGGSLDDIHSLPSSMAMIIKIDQKILCLDFAHVGDSWLTIYTQNGDSDLITDDKNKKFDDTMLELLTNTAKGLQISNRQARQEQTIKQALYDMYIKRNNNPDGSGSGFLNGDPNVKLYIQEGTVNLTNKKAILIGTDGLEIQGKSLADNSYRKYLWENYLDGGFEKLVTLKKMSENNDLDWNYARYKHSDDATGVMVKLN
jgi:hypothetical protein